MEYIEFILENCDTITIDTKDIVSYDITQSFDKSLKSFKCTVAEAANIEKYPFNISTLGHAYKIFDRLSYNDITQIRIVHDDTFHLDVNVDYNEESDDLGAQNVNQHTNTLENGDLSITICPL